jgi:hypothetical protein
MTQEFSGACIALSEELVWPKRKTKSCRINLVPISRKHDAPVALELRLLPNKIYTFDRTYNAMDFWLKIINAKSNFVTRLKEWESLKRLRLRVLNEKGDQNGVLYDGFYVASPAQKSSP